MPRASVVSAVLTFSASPIAATPLCIMLLPSRCSSLSALLTFSASAIVVAPSSPMLVPSRSNTLSVELPFSASAITVAYLSPMLVPYRCSSVSAALALSIPTTVVAPRLPISLSHRSSDEQSFGMAVVETSPFLRRFYFIKDVFFVALPSFYWIQTQHNTRAFFPPGGSDVNGLTYYLYQSQLCWLAMPTSRHLPQ